MLIVKLTTPVPERLKVPLLTIPPRNPNVDVFEDEKLQPDGTVTRPTKILVPVLLLSVHVPEPLKVRLEPAVKLEVLTFKFPLIKTAPDKETDPVVLQVMVPNTALVPETASVLFDEKLSVKPELTVRF